MPSVKLNEVQAWMLFRHLTNKAKGEPHAKRMLRLRKALQIDRIEETFEANRAISERYVNEGREAPINELHTFRWDDPQYECSVDEADLERIRDYTKDLRKEAELEGDLICKACKRPNEPPLDARVLVPMLAAFD